LLGRRRPDMPLSGRRIAHLPANHSAARGRWGRGQEEAAVG
jgi:hypothetical protein